MAEGRVRGAYGGAEAPPFRDPDVTPIYVTKRWRIGRRGDHGPELASRHFLAWCKEREVRMVDIEPGRPLPNGPVESFPGKFRDECLNVSWFGNRWEACQKVDAWRLEYNQERPHSRLGYRTPEEFAAGAPAPPASPPTLAGVLKTQGNGVENSTHRVSASARI